MVAGTDGGGVAAALIGRKTGGDSMDISNTIVRGNTAGHRQVRNFRLHAQISMFFIHGAVEQRHEPT